MQHGHFLDYTIVFMLYIYMQEAHYFTHLRHGRQALISVYIF